MAIRVALVITVEVGGDAMDLAISLAVLAVSAVSSFVSTRLDHSVPVLQSQGVRNLGCLRGLVLEAMAFSRDFVTAVTPVEPLTFNVCQGSMSIGVVKSIGG